MPCLPILFKKVKMIIPTSWKKPHNFLRKTKSYLKNPQMTLRNYIQISQRKRKKKDSWECVFCQNLGITGCTLENCSNLKSKFSINNGSIFEIHDYFRTRGNARFNDLSQLINTLSSQDFSGLHNLGNLWRTLDKLENAFCTRGVARKLNWCS